MDKKIAILIPCYNEELTIEKVITDFKKELPEAKIYVYNNNSKDKTEQIAKNVGAIVRNEYKQGKGNVIRSMFRDIEADIYVMVDGDDTYPASEVHKLIKVIENNEADMVVGDRLSNGSYKFQNKRRFHSLGNKLVKNTINSIFRTNLNDIMSGYRVFSRDFVKNCPICTQGFEVETEMTLHALDKNYKILEIPINYKNRPDGSYSKVNTFEDGFKVILTIFNTYKNYKPLSFFCSISILSIIVALIIGIPVFIEFFRTGLVTKFPRGILATGLVICGLLFFVAGIILDTLVKQHKENLEIFRNLNRKKGD